MWQFLSSLWLKFRPLAIHYAIFAGILAITIIGLIIAYRYYWYRTKTVIEPVIKTLTKVIPITKTKIKYHTILLTKTKIRYIPKTQYKTITKSALPTWLANSATTKIIATGKVLAYKGQTQVVSTLNIKSGKGDLYFQQLPYISTPTKFFSIKQKPFIEGGYGYMTDKYGSSLSGMVGAGDKIMRIGAINISINDNLYLNSNNTVNFLGVEAKYDFK